MTKKDYLHLNEIELISRRELAGIFKIGISSVDLIPERELPRVRIGKSVRFTKESIRAFIRRHEKTHEDKPLSINNSKNGGV
jgi:predicted DNA-binding transcriptional regulator AlpA